MTTIPDSPCASRAPAQADGFDVLDICHRQTVLAIGKLAAHITRLSIHGPDDAARSLAAEILHHFVATARQHHEDEERHVFPRLVASGDAELVQNVLRLQEDHDWLEEDWMEIHRTSPRLRTATSGTAWTGSALVPPPSPRCRTTTWRWKSRASIRRRARNWARACGTQ